MSQFDEDTHILAVLDEIGHGSKLLADIGARQPGSNSALLLHEHGWRGVLFDADEGAARELRAEFPQCEVYALAVTPMGINALLPPGLRFLSIDVDGQDWWLWAALQHRPALVVIETNPLEGHYVAPFRMAPGRDPATGYGCSVDSAKALAAMKGYDYLGRTAVNAFFCRSDLGCRYRLPPAGRHRGKMTINVGNVMA